MITVRDMALDETGDFARSALRTFASARRMTDEDTAYRQRAWQGQRLRGAFDGTILAGTFRSWDAGIVVPGGAVVDMDAISSVTVPVSHRRRGSLTAMMRADLSEAVGRGQAGAVLIASEAPIYGRFGFGPSTELCTWTLDRARVAWRHERPAVEVELLEDEELRDVGPAIYERARIGTPGAFPRPPLWWSSTLGPDYHPDVDRTKVVFAAVVHEDGQPAGYVRYAVEETWEEFSSRSVLSVKDMAATSPASYDALWRLVSEVDLVATVRADDRSTGEPLRHLLVDPRAAVQSARHDFLWVRVFDVAAVLSARRFAAAGSVVVEVVDDMWDGAGPASGRWRLSTSAGSVGEAAATTEPADVVLPVDVLGAVALGQVPLTPFLLAGRGSGDPGAVRALDAMLAWPGDGFVTATWF